MTQPGYSQGHDRVAWWKVAMHLDEAQQALASALAHEVDDPSDALSLHDHLRQAQRMLLGIFSTKGLLGAAEAPPPTVAVPSVVVDAASPIAADSLPVVVVDASPAPVDEVPEVPLVAETQVNLGHEVVVDEVPEPDDPPEVEA